MISRQRGIDVYRSEDTAKSVIAAVVTMVDLEIVSPLSFDQIQGQDQIKATDGQCTLQTWPYAVSWDYYNCEHPILTFTLHCSRFVSVGVPVSGRPASTIGCSFLFVDICNQKYRVSFFNGDGCLKIPLVSDK